MDDTEYRETMLQHALRVQWQRLTAKHPRWLNWTIGWVLLIGVGYVAVAIGAALTGLGTAVVVLAIAAVFMCDVAFFALLYLNDYAKRQVQRFDEYQRMVQERAEHERERARRERFSRLRDPDLPEDEFYRALLAVLAEMHGHPAEYLLESQINAALALARCDDETFLHELKRAELARRY